MNSFILTVLLSFGIAEAKVEHYEDALPLLIATEKMVGSDQYTEYWFYRAVSHHQLIQKEQALKALNNLEDSFQKMPLRYKNIANLMKIDLDSWETSGINNIERLMNSVGRRLNQGYGGEETQRQQRKIVQKLDELIKQEEAKASGQMAKGCPDGGAKPGPIMPNNEKRSEQAAIESIIMGGTGDGKTVVDNLRHVASTWGTLPPAKRAQVIQELTRDLPPKYEPLIKRYFEALDKGKK